MFEITSSLGCLSSRSPASQFLLWAVLRPCRHWGWMPPHLQPCCAPAASGLLARPWRLQTALPAEVSGPSDRSCLELSVQGQRATMLPATFRATRWFSLERNPVSSSHSQHACNQFLSREALLHCIENWSGTESFWP